jgi:hypothetical protein
MRAWSFRAPLTSPANRISAAVACASLTDLIGHAPKQVTFQLLLERPMSGEIKQFGPITTTDLGAQNVLVTYPYDPTVNFELRKAFNETIPGPKGQQSQVQPVKNDKGEFGYVVALQGKQTVGDVEAWAGKMHGQGYFADKTVGNIKSTEFITKNPDLAKLPGIAVKVIGGQIAVEMPRNEQGQAAMRELGAQWRPGSRGVNRQTGQAYENKGSWRFDVAGKDDMTIRSALTRASAGVIEMTRTSEQVKGLAPPNDAINLQLIPGNPNPNAKNAAPHDRVLLMTPKDDNANAMLKAGGTFEWNKGLGGFVADATNREAVSGAVTGLAKYYDSMVVPPSADRPGMTAEKLDMLAKAPAIPASTADIANVKAAYAHVKETFSLEERAALSEHKPGDHVNAQAGRIAALPETSFAAVAAVVPAIERAHAQVQAQEIATAQATIAAAQSQQIAAPAQAVMR